MDSLLKLLEIFLHNQHSIYTINTIIRSVKSVYHGSESISCLEPKISGIVPAKIKETNLRNSFKIEIRKWVPQSCPCRLFKQYISGVDFSSVVHV